MDDIKIDKKYDQCIQVGWLTQEKLDEVEPIAFQIGGSSIVSVVTWRNTFASIIREVINNKMYRFKSVFTRDTEGFVETIYRIHQGKIRTENNDEFIKIDDQYYIDFRGNKIESQLKCMLKFLVACGISLEKVKVAYKRKEDDKAAKLQFEKKDIGVLESHNGQKNDEEKNGQGFFFNDADGCYNMLTKGCFKSKPNERLRKITGGVYMYDQKVTACTTSGRKPVSLFVCGVEYQLKNWRDLMVKTCDILNERNKNLLRELSDRLGSTFLSANPNGMRTPKLHMPSGLYMEMWLPAYSLLLHSKWLFSMFNYNLKHVYLLFVPRDKSPTENENTEINPEDGTNESDIELNEKIIEVLRTNFKNGLRPESPIDQKKMCRAFYERFHESIPENYELKSILPSLGIMHEGKVFPKPNMDAKGCRKIIDELILSGHKVFSFSRIMDLHATEMIAEGIVSSGMLKELVEKFFKEEFWVKKKYFGCKDYPCDIEVIIQNSLEKNQVLFAEKELIRKLLYIDSEDIHHVLTSSKKYFKNSPGIYAISEYIEFDEKEKSSAIINVRNEIDNHGYFSLSQLDFLESISINDGRLTESVIRKVFFYRYLADNFDIHGQILCQHGVELDGRYPLIDYCRTHSELTIEQIYELSKEYNISGDIALLVAYEEKVRVNENLFVSPEMVEFNVKDIDKELSVYCTNDVSTLDAVNFNELSSVPGYPWNQFLLGSFLRRESSLFTLITPSTASRELAGVIVRRKSEINDSISAFAKVAVDNRIEADVRSVGDFLVEKRCVMRRGSSLLQQVVSKMKEFYGAMR